MKRRAKERAALGRQPRQGDGREEARPSVYAWHGTNGGATWAFKVTHILTWAFKQPTHRGSAEDWRKEFLRDCLCAEHKSVSHRLFACSRDALAPVALDLSPVAQMPVGVHPVHPSPDAMRPLETLPPEG